VCDALCVCGGGAGLCRCEVAFEGLMVSTYPAVLGLLMQKAVLWPGVIPQCLPRINFHKAKETQLSGDDIPAKSGTMFLLKNLLIKPGVVWEWSVEITQTKNFVASCGSVSLGKCTFFKGLEYFWSLLLLNILPKCGTSWQGETQGYLCVWRGFVSMGWLAVKDRAWGLHQGG